MGSSVVHGGISTFLAVLVLSMAKSYIFVVFFKLWFGIVVFGMSNGFILLPIILSFVGPTPDFTEKVQAQERRFSRRLSLKPAQIAEMQKKAKVDPESGNHTDISMPNVTDDAIASRPPAKGITEQSEIEMESGANHAQQALPVRGANPGSIQ